VAPNRLLTTFSRWLSLTTKAIGPVTNFWYIRGADQSSDYTPQARRQEVSEMNRLSLQKLLAQTVAAVAIALFWCASAVGTTVGVTSLAAVVNAVTSTPAQAYWRRRGWGWGGGYYGYRGYYGRRHWRRRRRWRRW
jgi:hypothetical protein